MDANIKAIAENLQQDFCLVIESTAQTAVLKKPGCATTAVEWDVAMQAVKVLGLKLAGKDSTGRDNYVLKF